MSNTITIPVPDHPAWYVVQGYNEAYRFNLPSWILVPLIIFGTIIVAAVAMMAIDAATGAEGNGFIAGICVFGFGVWLAVTAGMNNSSHLEPAGEMYGAAVLSQSQAAEQFHQAWSENRVSPFSYRHNTYKIDRVSHAVPGEPDCLSEDNCTGLGSNIVPIKDFERNPAIQKRVLDYVKSRYGATSFDNAPVVLKPDSKWTVASIRGARSYTLPDGSHRQCLATYANVKASTSSAYPEGTVLKSLDVPRFICDKGAGDFGVMKPLGTK